jgi:hypothetical protein
VASPRHPGRGFQPRRSRGIRGHHPGRQAHKHRNEREAIERAPLCRRSRAAAFARQPVAREARHDAPTDERDEQKQRCDAQAVSHAGGVRDVERVQVDQHVAGKEQRQRDEHREVAPVASGDQLACNQRNEEGEE